MKKRWLFSLLVAVVFIWTAGGVAAAPMGKITAAFTGQPSTFDPHKITGLPIAFQYPNIFDTLLYRSPDGKLIPHLAVSWKLVTPKVWEFKLRKGVKFSNGETMDANAVKFSIERIIAPGMKTRQISYFRSVARVEVVDKYTARVHTKKPDMMLPNILSGYGQIVPPKYYSKTDPKILARKPVGSGPFRMAKWGKNQEIVYEANPNYWKPGVPKAKTVVLKLVTEATTRVAALVSGTVDIIDNVPPQLASLVKNNSKTQIMSGPSPRAHLVMMTIKKGSPWANPKVRMAMNYAVDKDSIIKNIFQGNAEKINVLQGPGSFGQNPNLKPYPYNPAKAKKLLAEAGFPNGFQADMFVPHGRYLMGKQAAEAVASYLDAVGIKVKMLSMEWGAFVRKSRARWKPGTKPYMWYSARMDLQLHADGMYAGFIHGKATWGGFRDAGVDKLLGEARGEPNEAKRVKMYHNINRILHDDKVPLIFLYRVNQIHAKKKNVDWRLRTNGLVLLNEVGRK